MLDPVEEQALLDQLIRFHARTGHALVVVTAPSLRGEDIAAYTLELFGRWGVGRKGVDDGVVLLVAPRERKVRIATGFGMETKVPNELAARIIRDSITPNFQRGDMAEGIRSGVDALSAAMTAR